MLRIKNTYIVLLLLLVGLSRLIASPVIDTLRKHLEIMSLKEQMTYFAELSLKQTINDPTRGVQFGEKSLEISRKLNDKFGEGKALFALGVNQWALFHDEKYIMNTKRALSIFQELGNEEEQARVLLELGFDFNDQGKYDQAFELFIKSMELSKKNNCEVLIAMGNNGLGLVYYNQHQALKSLDCYFEAAKIYNKIGKFNQLASIYNNIAVNYCDRNDYSNAQKYYEMAFDCYVKTNNKGGMGLCLSNLGDLYFMTKDYNKCLKANYQSLKINKEVNSKFALVYNYTNLGQVYAELKQYQKADSNYQTALKIAKEIKSYPQLVDIYSFLAGLYEVQKDFHKALEYFKLYKASNDSVFTKSSSDKLVELQTKYETEKISNENEQLKTQNELKEHKIKSQFNIVLVLSISFILVVLLLLVILNNRKNLKKTNIKLEEHRKEINEKNQTLDKLNKTKDRLFSIISHDLRSPFTVLLNLSQLIFDEIDTLTKLEIKELVGNINTSSQNVFNLLENLLKWSRIQLGGISSKPVNFDINLKINNAIGLLRGNASDKNIEIINRSSENSIVYADEDMIFSVLLNLLSNAIKFSYKGGEIEFCSNFRESLVEISVVDNGVGILPKDLDKLFITEENHTTFGTMNEKGSGLGLSLCKSILELNNGKISVTSIPQKGSKFSFTLPRG